LILKLQQNRKNRIGKRVYYIDMTKLEQCPFCWGTNLEIAVVGTSKATVGGYQYIIDRFAVVCPACGAHGPSDTDGEKAETRWNIRGPVDEGLIKYIEEVRKI
jgi:YgiT-type zinc finger domain-containing protein